MKFIVQNWDGGIYAYIETEKQFKQNEKNRGTLRVDPKELAEECNLHSFPGRHFVIEIK